MKQGGVARESDADLQVEFGMVEKEVAGKRVHALPAEEDEVVPAIDGDGDGCVGVVPVSPMHGSVGIP